MSAPAIPTRIAAPPLLLAATLLGLAGCQAPDPLDIDEVEPIGSLGGAFTCVVNAADEERFDLGPARFEGELESTGFVAGLRTQGCLARRIVGERGDVISVTLLQHLRLDRAQVLELNLPVDVLRDRADSPLVVDDTLIFAGKGGFGSMYVLDPGDEPNLFARVAGGGVLLSVWGSEQDEVIAGSFANLRMGAL